MQKKNAKKKSEGNEMKAYHELLVKAERDKRAGNHRVEVYTNNRYFYYHGHNVCSVDDEKKTYELDFCGYSESISTKDCLAGYRQYFDSIGYTQINPKLIYNYER